MRVDILMNGKAGYAKRDEIESRVKRVLFRCELRFYFPESIPEMQWLIEEGSDEGTECFIIAGGDGTLNATLTPIMARRKEGKPTPPLCLVPVGTANDLATDLGIPKKIEKAARAVLEGKIRHVDVIEVTSGGKTAHMLTNGGLGIPAQTALSANQLRSWVRTRANRESTPRSLKPIFKLGERFITGVGPRIYEFLLFRDLARWDPQAWEVAIEVPGQAPVVTRAPMILINNQPALGGGFTPAPLTSNDDGKFNVFLFKPTSLPEQIKTVLDVRRGQIHDQTCPTFEAPAVKLRAMDASKPLMFFGDGEILHQDVREIELKCIHPGIRVVTLDD